MLMMGERNMSDTAAPEGVRGKDKHSWRSTHKPSLDPGEFFKDINVKKKHD